ncbi:MAG: catalase family protein [Planctomycetes bacterium]|nr:catalase family protein [Planctomycetota bacterium]MCW8135959.1 catalase family protein [Planctomycetota bacterium]
MPDPAAETIPADEAVLIARLVEQNLALLNERERPVRRGQHAKHHGCVLADFVVEPDLPAELRHGLFAEARTYKALIRFSNGEQRDDRKGDAHGMAIKLFDVAGDKLLEPSDTHDFILLDQPLFFIRDVADYVGLFDALLKAKASVVPKLMFFAPRFAIELGLVYFSFLRSRPTELEILKRTVSSKPQTPLATTFHSTTPYRLGPHAARWSAVPDLGKLPKFTAVNSPDKLRHALAMQLGGAEASFDFMAQLQTDPATMPIEDPTQPWDAAKSPPRKLATLRLPVQRPDTQELMAFCEHLSFNPWRCLAEHRPIGGINRARRQVYAAVSRRRHELNGVPQREPALAEFLALHA